MEDTAVDLVNVADAFDVGDAFDVRLSLSFGHEQRSADVRRETSINQPGLTSGGYTSESLIVGRYHESTQRLTPALEVGLFRDFSLSVRLPVILAHNRRLESLNGSGEQSALVAQGVPGEQLFTLPFESPTRSGIEYLALGLDLGLMNQFRNPALPTWVVGIEGRFNVSEPMHACAERPADGEVACAFPSDIDRDGVADPLGSAFAAELQDGGDLADELEGNFEGSREPGVSRGTHAIEGHAYVSRRVKYIEPYTGIEALAEFQASGSDYGPTDLEGVVVNHPPIRGTVVAGLAIVPWEQVENYQRVVIDFRVAGTYVSEGRDYSELFDALGSSSAPSLRRPNFASYQPNQLPNGQVNAFAPSVVDPASRRVNFTGLTDVQQHGDYKLSTRFSWQAGRYVKFDLGASWRIIQAHFITFDQACNPSLIDNVTVSGPCKSQVGDATSSSGVTVPLWQAEGTPNPLYRAAINTPGRRFKVGTSHGVNVWLRANVLF